MSILYLEGSFSPQRWKFLSNVKGWISPLWLGEEIFHHMLVKGHLPVTWKNFPPSNRIFFDMWGRIFLLLLVREFPACAKRVSNWTCTIFLVKVVLDPFGYKENIIWYDWRFFKSVNNFWTMFFMSENREHAIICQNVNNWRKGLKFWCSTEKAVCSTTGGRRCKMVLRQWRFEIRAPWIQYSYHQHLHPFSNVNRSVRCFFFIYFFSSLLTKLPLWFSGE